MSVPIKDYIRAGCRARKATKQDLVERAESLFFLVEGEGLPVLQMAHLTKEQLVQIIDWCQVCMYEASDNPCRARYAPKALRDLLPAEHRLHTWRKPRRG